MYGQTTMHVQFRVVVVLKPIPTVMGCEAGYALDGLPVSDKYLCSNLYRWPINNLQLTKHVCLDDGRKPGYLLRTHARWVAGWTQWVHIGLYRFLFSTVLDHSELTIGTLWLMHQFSILPKDTEPVLGIKPPSSLLVDDLFSSLCCKFPADLRTQNLFAVRWR